MSSANYETSADGHAGYQPVIVVAAPNSGAELLTDALACHPDVAKLPTDLAQPMWRQRNLAIRHDEFTADQFSESIAAGITRQFELAAKRTGASVVIQATPANSLRVEFVQQCLPHAKFLFIARDGRDVLLTAPSERSQRTPFGKATSVLPVADWFSYACESITSRLASLIPFSRTQSVEGPQFRGMDAFARRYGRDATLAKQWATCLERAADAFERLIDDKASCWGEELVLPLRYESLVTAPDDDLDAVCEFLGLSIDDQALERAGDLLIEAPVDLWRSANSADQFESVAEILDPMLTQFGYPKASRPAATTTARAA